MRVRFTTFYREVMRRQDIVFNDADRRLFIDTVGEMAERFVKKIKKGYLPDVLHAEMPSQKRVARDINIESVISEAARQLDFDLELCRKSVRIPNWAKTDRDLLIYLVWQMGVATNLQIGKKFGLSYSAVS